MAIQFTELDSDLDGKLSRTELIPMVRARARPSPHTIVHALKFMDVGAGTEAEGKNDKKVTFEEFEKAYNRLHQDMSGIFKKLK
jgi:hypothetical protein